VTHDEMTHDEKTYDEKAALLWDLTEESEELQQKVRDLMGALDRHEESTGVEDE